MSSCRLCRSWEEDCYYCRKHLKARTPNNFCGDFKNKNRKCETCNGNENDYCRYLDKPCGREHTGCSHWKESQAEALEKSYKQLGW